VIDTVGLDLTPEEAAVFEDGSAARLFELEERYGSQRTVLDAYPELAATAAAVQRIRAKWCAREFGFELRGDGVPFPEHILAAAELAFRRLVTVAPDDPDALPRIATSTGTSRPDDDDLVDERA
jgi:hypothetical protein